MLLRMALFFLNYPVRISQKSCRATIPAPDDVECRIDDIALSDVINRFLSKLDKEKRNIFIRRYWYLDSIAAISERFALSESKVKTMLFRCRNQLREHLEKEGYIL